MPTENPFDPNEVVWYFGEPGKPGLKVSIPQINPEVAPCVFVVHEPTDGKPGFPSYHKNLAKQVSVLQYQDTLWRSIPHESAKRIICGFSSRVTPQDESLAKVKQAGFAQRAQNFIRVEGVWYEHCGEPCWVIKKHNETSYRGGTKGYKIGLEIAWSQPDQPPCGFRANQVAEAVVAAEGARFWRDNDIWPYGEIKLLIPYQGMQPNPYPLDKEAVERERSWAEKVQHEAEENKAVQAVQKQIDHQRDLAAQAEARARQLEEQRQTLVANHQASLQPLKKTFLYVTDREL